ncbi:hypothetical protein OV142_35520 [Nannocystis sp. SCPEA4]|nr:hypothetical protein [Nannocystis sp. SCPEA4]
MMWVQSEQNGDRVVELCNEACMTNLAGALELELFCEAAWADARRRSGGRQARESRTGPPGVHVSPSLRGGLR